MWTADQHDNDATAAVQLRLLSADNAISVLAQAAQAAQATLGSSTPGLGHHDHSNPITFVPEVHPDPSVTEPCLGVHLCGIPATIASLSASGRRPSTMAKFASMLSLIMPQIGIGPMPPALFAAMR